MLKKLIWLSLLCLTFQSCKYNLGEASWETDLLAPLAHGTLRMRNLIPDTLLQTQGDGSLKLVYEKNLVGIPLDSLLRLPDTPIVFVAPVFLNGQSIPPGFAIPIPPSPTRFNLKDAQVTYIRMKSGRVDMVIINEVATNLVIDYSIPKASKNGIPFQTTQIIPPTSTVSLSFDMSGYEFDMRGLNSNSYNTINSNFTVKTDPNGPTVIATAQSFKITNTFFDLVPDYAKGYMGSQHTVIGPKESPVEPLSKLISGSLMTESVKIGLELRNGVGADMRFTVLKLEGRNAYNGVVIPLTHQIIGNPINITRAQDMGSGSNPSVYNYEMNYNNSNLQPFIENLPGIFNYHVDVALNPLGNISGGNDFIYSNSELAANLKVEMPLNFNAGNLGMLDTIDFNTTSTFIEKFKGGALKVYVDNGFHLEAEVKLTLLDTFYQPLDELIGQGVVAPAILGADLKVSEHKNSVVTAPVTVSKAEKLKQTKHIAMKLRFNTPAAGQLIKIFDNYTIDVRIVADVTVEL